MKSLIKWAMGHSDTQQRAHMRMVEEFSSQLPEDYNLHELYAIAEALERQGFMGRWLYWTEVAVIAYQQGAVQKDKLTSLEAVLAFPFYMLDKGERLIVGEYRIQPPERNMDEGWYRFDLNMPTLSNFRPEAQHQSNDLGGQEVQP